MTELSTSTVVFTEANGTLSLAVSWVHSVVATARIVK